MLKPAHFRTFCSHSSAILRTCVHVDGLEAFPLSALPLPDQVVRQILRRPYACTCRCNFFWKADLLMCSPLEEALQVCQMTSDLACDGVVEERTEHVCARFAGRETSPSRLCERTHLPGHSSMVLFTDILLMPVMIMRLRYIQKGCVMMHRDHALCKAQHIKSNALISYYSIGSYNEPIVDFKQRIVRSYFDQAMYPCSQ